MTLLLATNFLFMSLFSLMSCDKESFDSDAGLATRIASIFKLCPYTNYCTGNQKQDNTEVVPCCGACSCANNCWERGACCPDKQNVTLEQPLQSCVLSVVKPSPYNHPSMFEGNLVQRYFVTKSCPRKDDALAEQCTGNLRSSLEDFIWVTDVTTRQIYNNKHCAICNGVESYRPWQIKTDCTEALNGKNSPEAAVDYILDECSLIVIPPIMEDHTDNTCMVPDITQCNATGEWDFYDPALETACKSFNQLYLDESLIYTTSYKNPFCFLCNSPKGQRVSKICTNRHSDFKFVGNSFSGILNFEAFEMNGKTGANDELGPDPVCAINEKNDPAQSRCLNLSCPLLHAPIYGRCVKLTTETNMLGVTAILLLEPIWSKTTLEHEELRNNEKFARKLLVKVLRELLGEKCKPCTETVTVYADNTSQPTVGEKAPEMFVIDLIFETTKTCREDTVAERLSWLVGRELKQNSGQKLVTMKVSAAPRDAYNFYRFEAGGKVILETTLYWCPNADLVDFKQLLRCPSVSLNATDYLRLMRMTDKASGKRDINSLFGLSYMEDKIAQSMEKNFTAQVCYASYQSVVKAKNHGVTLLGMKTVVTGISLISMIYGI